MVSVIIITFEETEILRVHVLFENPELMPKGIILTASLYVTKVVLTGTDFPKIHALNGKSTP